MTRILAAFVFSVAIGVILAASMVAASPESLLKARIAQLEIQLQQIQAELIVCSARSVVATQATVAQEQQKQRAAIEKDAGCAIDWTVNPPVCKRETTVTK